MASVQRLMMYFTPMWTLNLMCRICPKTVIGLFCHWANEKNPDIEERGLANRRLNLAQVAKKFSQLSDRSILRLLRQDSSLWRMYLSGMGVRPFPDLPYLLLQLIFDLGGQEGKEKVKRIVMRTRVILGGGKQGQIMEYFKTDTVIELFEMLPAAEIGTRLRLTSQFADPAIVAIWLTHWDLRRRECERDAVSHYWLTQLPAALAFDVEERMRAIEFRRPLGDVRAEQFGRGRRY
ncbi:hypothetical protein CSA56_13335 [candidate division KSB3 bacterium]|uniref:Uncharacterized protein n=1 Tax=candidate division KSB3 bacterium TaxID=2044937 RepID=A0A2G6KDH9_9BACT|nr:MAG: hypothetical protein CSA56_13335 [candidate division KSB3 bacterium]